MSALSSVTAATATFAAEKPSFSAAEIHSRLKPLDVEKYRGGKVIPPELLDLCETHKLFAGKVEDCDFWVDEKTILKKRIIKLGVGLWDNKPAVLWKPMVDYAPEYVVATYNDRRELHLDHYTDFDRNDRYTHSENRLWNRDDPTEWGHQFLRGGLWGLSAADSKVAVSLTTHFCDMIQAYVASISKKD